MPALPGGAQDRICLRQEQRVFDLAEAHSRRTGCALVLSEFGATDDETTLGRTIMLADRNMMSWQYWAYFGRDPCCERPEEGIVHDPSRPPTGDNVKQYKLDLLARPFPRVVAGTPERFSFDPRSGRFELRHSTAGPAGGRPARDETEVFLPERHFGAGYEVEVTGAEVVSAPGESVLRLRIAQGAARVALACVPG
jgi:endoglycosylceramidase